MKADIDKTIKNLEKRGFAVRYFEEEKTAADYLTEEITDTAVGMGGSVTLQELDIYDRLRETNEVYWHWRESGPDVLGRATRAPVYLMSANGVAETGEIINIDGTGNRTKNMLYGPERVYIVVGVNKLAKSYEDALLRARNIAAPENARRLEVKTPCAVRADKCYDCASPARICRGLVVLWEKPFAISHMEVVIIDRELGF